MNVTVLFYYFLWIGCSLLGCVLCVMKFSHSPESLAGAENLQLLLLCLYGRGNSKEWFSQNTYRNLCKEHRYNLSNNRRRFSNQGADSGIPAGIRAKDTALLFCHYILFVASGCLCFHVFSQFVAAVNPAPSTFNYCTFTSVLITPSFHYFMVIIVALASSDPHHFDLPWQVAKS